MTAIRRTAGMEPNRCNDACARSRFSGRRFPLCSHRKPVPTGTQRLSSRSWPRVRRQSRPDRRALAAEGAIMALVERRSRTRHAADDPGLAGLGRGSTPAEGRAESVPEAGGTGADAAATPTTPPPVTTQTHAKSTASAGGDRWSAGEHPATGRPGCRRRGTSGSREEVSQRPWDWLWRESGQERGSTCCYLPNGSLGSFGESESGYDRRMDLRFRVHGDPYDDVVAKIGRRVIQQWNRHDHGGGMASVVFQNVKVAGFRHGFGMPSLHPDAV